MRALLLVALLLLAGAPVRAQEPPAEPATPRSWQSLSPQQQQLLHNFQGNWDSLPADKQQALTRGSDRWIHMTPEERSGAQERFKTWRALPPDQRQQLRERWHQFKALPPERQQQIRQQFNNFRQMSPERQQALRNQWRNMSPEERRGAMEHGMSGMPRACRPATPAATRPHGPRRGTSATDLQTAQSEERIRKRLFSGASSEKLAPRPGTTSTTHCVCAQRLN